VISASREAESRGRNGDAKTPSSRTLAFVPTFWSVMSAQVLIGGTSSIFNTAMLPLLGEMLAKGHGRLTKGSGRFNRRFHRASLWFQRGLSISGRGRGGRTRHPLLLHAGDTR